MRILMQNLLQLQTLEFGKRPADSRPAIVTELRGKISPQILVHYDRLRAHGKKGIAEVRNQVCTGCHMRVPLGLIMTIKHNQDIQLCDNCGRYLYLADETETVPVVSPPAVMPFKIPRKKAKPVATV
jgi:C4-type zinc ribbon domain